MESDLQKQLADAEEVCSHILKAASAGTAKELFLCDIANIITAESVRKRRNELLRCVHPDKVGYISQPGSIEQFAEASRIIKEVSEHLMGELKNASGVQRLPATQNHAIQSDPYAHSAATYTWKRTTTRRSDIYSPVNKNATCGVYDFHTTLPYRMQCGKSADTRNKRTTTTLPISVQVIDTIILN